jgi:ribonuclease HII
VVAAAVILPPDFTHPTLNDSKQLSAALREQICAELQAQNGVFWAVGIVDHTQIDRLNILGATYLAMRAAVQALPETPDFLLIDGRPVPSFSRLKQTAIVKGDAKSYSIAAASVIAKVTRDRIMDRHHETWPQYQFKNHKGYATAEHLAALAKLGPSPIHRTSFFPVRTQAENLELGFS